MTVVTRRRSTTIAVAAIACMGAAGLALSTTTATATPSGKVTICHATASTTNPYVVKTVDMSSVDEERNKYLNGHGNHVGPVFDPNGGKSQPAWGDIIPPFTNTAVPNGSVFPGLNWPAGAAILDHDCQVPDDDGGGGGVG
jgi:hypothetical protein